MAKNEGVNIRLLARALLSMALLAGAVLSMPATGAPLTSEQQQVLREGRSSREGAFRSAMLLVQQLARSGEGDAIPFLVELGDEPLLGAFANEWRGDATPELERLALERRRDPRVGQQLLRMLRKHRSAALFRALLEDMRDPRYARARDPRDGFDATAYALAQTSIAGVEPELAALLPSLHADWSVPLVELLASRQAPQTKPVLLELLPRAQPGPALGLSDLARVATRQGDQELMDAAVRRLAQLRSLPPTPPRVASARMTNEQLGLQGSNKDLAGLVEAVRLAPPRVKLDPRLLPASSVQEFAPEHRQRVLAMIAARAEEESRFERLTPANFTFFAARRDRLPELQSFIDRGADVNARGEGRATPLSAAVSAGNTRAVQLLLQAGADPDLADAEGLTPLMRAVKDADADAVQLLLRAGADPNLADPRGQTALHFAAGRSSKPEGAQDATLVELARGLLAAGARASPRDRHGRTPLHDAAAGKFRTMARVLVEAGAEVNAEATQEGLPGLTPLQVAEDQADKETVEYLRGKEAGVNTTFALKRAAQRAMGAVIAPMIRMQ